MCELGGGEEAAMAADQSGDEWWPEVDEGGDAVGRLWVDVGRIAHWLVATGWPSLLVFLIKTSKV